MAAKKEPKVTDDGGGGGVATIPDDTGEMVPMTQELIVAWLAGEDITEEDATDEFDYATAMKILGADTPEAALAQDDVRKFADLVGKQIVITAVTWRKSTKSDDGKGRYAVLSCADADGVPFLSSCGATKVVLQVRKGQLDGWLPWQVEVSASETSNGRTVYELVMPTPDF